MTGAIANLVASGRRDCGVLPVHFSLLLAKLAVIAATGGRNDRAREGLSDETENQILPVADEKRLTVLRGFMSDSSFSYFVDCYLLDVEFHLDDMARAWAAHDCARLARKADILAGTAADIGAMRVSAAARRLDVACRAGDTAQARALIGELSRSCIESEMELRGVLIRHAWPKSAA